MHKDSHKFTDTGKYCPSCDRTLPNENFCKNKRYVSGLNHYCRECARRNLVFVIYKLTATQHRTLLEAQNYKCANTSCGEVVDMSSDIDHDQTCCDTEKNYRTCGKCVRGVLCRRCNNLLGFIEEPGQLQGALDYLNNYKAKKNSGIMEQFEQMVEAATGVTAFYTTAENIEKNLGKTN